MSSGLMFVVAVLLLAVVSIWAVYKSPKKAMEYFKTKDGKGVLKGILIFAGLGLVVVLLSSAADASEKEGTWFSYGEVYLGLDNTFKVSPQCEEGGPSDRLTSNGGVRFNIYRSYDRKFHLNGKYTHHSCAFSPDRYTYDAVGLEASYRFFGM